jgi:hypothetical protein
MYIVDRLVLLAVLACLILLPSPVTSYPSGILGCDAGRGAILMDFSGEVWNPHSDYTQVGGGPISDYNITMQLNGKDLYPNIRVEFEVNKDYTLSLVATGTEFSGFLIRMDSPADENIRTDAILPIEELDPITGTETTGGAKQSTICTSAWFVPGVCHDSRSKKTRIEMNLNMDTITENLVLDVSVVARTSKTEKISEWYYSNFTLNAIPSSEVDPTNSQNVFSPETGVPTIDPSSESTRHNDEITGMWIVSSTFSIFTVWWL